MKGQTMAAIAAVEAHLQAGGGLPVNVKFLIEGEEEIGSRNLRELIRERGKARLAADYCLNNDGGMPAPEHPAITLRPARHGAHRSRGVRARAATSTRASTAACSTTRPRRCAS